MKVEKIKQNAFVKKVGFNRIVLIFVLLLMYLAFGVLTGGSFFGFSRISNTLNYVYFLGFLSLGVTFVIATGGIDFSIGPVMFCCSLVSGYCLTTYGVPMAISLVMSILIGVLFGVFNGYLVAYWKVPPFIVSMASMNIAKGIAAVFTKTQSVSWPQSTTADGWTKNGSNVEAVRLSGVNVKRWKMLAYIICGTLVGIASIFFVAAYTTVQPGYGDQYNNEAIAGCVMGGTSMAGGLASISGTVIGVIIISLLQQGILALGFTKEYQYIITGLIVIAAVYSDVSARRRKN